MFLCLAGATAIKANHSAPNLVERLQSDGRFNTLLTALMVTGLKETVATGGVFTVFAPTDEAFAALPPGTVEALVENPPALANILLYHAVAGRQSLWRLLQNSTATTLQGNPVLLTTDGARITVNNQQIISSTLNAGNGVIYPVKGVLLPPANPVTITSLADVLALDGRFTTLLAAVQAAGLTDAVTTGGPFTLFAPTDAAFAALPPGTVESLLAQPDALRRVLLYHVLGERATRWELIAGKEAETLAGPGVSFSLRMGRLYVNDSRVINANIKAPNGIIHTIDAVLLPPPPEANLLETLKNDGRFDTLVAALEAAGLDAPLATGGPLTVFAPTDAAFAALPPGTVEGLLADIDALKNILLYHVVSGEKNARSLLRERHVTTLQGSAVNVYRRWAVFVNRSKVIEGDIDSSNGIIHAINAVLLPPAAPSRDEDDD
jgi:uncharacterized surface protein with fasciclin (FAS1) repeats